MTSDGGRLRVCTLQQVARSLMWRARALLSIVGELIFKFLITQPRVVRDDALEDDMGDDGE